MLLWKFVHVAFVFAALAIPLAGSAIPMLVARTEDPRAIRVTFAAWGRMANLIVPLFGIGGIAGFVTTLMLGYDLLRPWLVLSYVLVAAVFVVALRFEAPWNDRVYQAARTSPDDAPSAELLAAVRDPAHPRSFATMTAIVVAIVFVMVVKPLG